MPIIINNQSKVINSANITLSHESFWAVCISGGMANTWFFKPTAVMIRRTI